MPIARRLAFVAGACGMLLAEPSHGQPITEVRHDVSIGDLRGSPEYVVGNVAQLALGASGRVHIIDNLSRAVHQFDSQGVYQQSIGRRGFGPAEFQAPWSATASGPYLVVRDIQLERYTVFDSLNAIRASWPAPNQRAYWEPMHGDARGHAYVSVRTWADSTSPHFVLRFDPVEGPEEGDTIPLPHRVRSFVSAPGGVYVDQPFRERLLWAVAPDGDVWWADSGSNELTKGLGPTATTMPLAPFDPIEVPRAARDSATAAVREDLEGRLADAGHVDDAMRMVVVPEHYPPVASLLIDSEGRFWVGRPSPPTDRRVRLDVVSPAGQLLSTLLLVLPNGQTPELDLMVVAPEAVWVPTVDSLGVSRVLRFSRPDAG